MAIAEKETTVSTDGVAAAVIELTPFEKCMEGLPKKLEYTDKQKRSLRVYKILVAAGVLIAIVLAVLRWFLGGWWLDWVDEKNGSPFSGTSQTEETEEPQGVIGDFVAPPHDEAAVVGVPTVAEELGWANLNVQQGYVVHVCGILNANEDGTLPVWFASDADNTVWVRLRVMDAEGNRLGETGILYPGEYVELVQLSEDAVSGDVTLQVLGYEPETYYSAGTVGLSTELVMPD